MTITKEKFNSYEKVRLSGRYNMFEINNVCMESGLTKEECLNIMENYGKYKEELK